jgi:protein SCO1
MTPAINRRQLFANFASGASCSVSGSPGARHYTNAVFRTHENKEVRFYDDLIKDKHVLINFMYARCTGSCPLTTANLVKVQKRLGKRVGKDVFMYSITIKPEEDDPAALNEYVKKYDIGPGWLFLTGSTYDMNTVRARIMNMGHEGIDTAPERHTGSSRAINDALNRTFACSTLASTETIVQVVRWCERDKPLAEQIRQNAIIQAKIDKMKVLPTWLTSLADEA